MEDVTKYTWKKKKRFIFGLYYVLWQDSGEETDNRGGMACRKRPGAESNPGPCWSPLAYTAQPLNQQTETNVASWIKSLLFISMFMFFISCEGCISWELHSNTTTPYLASAITAFWFDIRPKTKQTPIWFDLISVRLVCFFCCPFVLVFDTCKLKPKDLEIINGRDEDFEVCLM